MSLFSFRMYFLTPHLSRSYGGGMSSAKAALESDTKVSISFYFCLSLEEPSYNGCFDVISITNNMLIGLGNGF